MARRSMVSTMPADPPFGSQAWLSDRPSWCVDLGPTLRAMTTCDLWLGLAKGEISPEMKVWREGMPYWRAVGRVPEFALAMPDASVWSPAPAGVSAVPAAIRAAVNRPMAAVPVTAIAELAAVREESAEAANDAAGPESAVGIVTLVPPSDFSTPAPVVVEHDDAPPVSQARPRAFPRLDRRGAASVVIGAVVAITALALATTGPGPSSDARPAPAARPAAATELDLRGGSFDRSEPVRAAAPATTVESTIPTQTAPPVAPAAAPRMQDKQRLPRGPHAGDRGQRRSRAGIDRSDRPVRPDARSAVR